MTAVLKTQWENDTHSIFASLGFKTFCEKTNKKKRFKLTKTFNFVVAEISVSPALVMLSEQLQSTSELWFACHVKSSVSVVWISLLPTENCFSSSRQRKTSKWLHREEKHNLLLAAAGENKRENNGHKYDGQHKTWLNIESKPFKPTGGYRK